jgi:hypothetical protein
VNLNWTWLNLNLRFGSGFGKILKEPDRTEPVHHYQDEGAVSTDAAHLRSHFTLPFPFLLVPDAGKEDSESWDDSS